MKNIILTIVAIFCALTVSAQENSGKRAWEIGLGGSVYQFNRIPLMNIVTTDEGTTVNMKLRHVAYTGNLYFAKELSNVFALDFQPGLGRIEGKWLAHAQIGIQMRMGHWFDSPYIDPYIRIGAGYMYKGYQILYADGADETRWSFVNNYNKEGADAMHTFPVTAGIGINMWLNNRFGIGLAGDYLYIPKHDVANSISGSVRLIWRIGGKTKRPAPVKVVETVMVPEYRDREVIREVEKIVEVPAAAETIQDLMDQVTFDFDKSDLKQEYVSTVGRIAALMKQHGGNYLITGFTDTRGSDRYNERLSLDRARTIRQALIEQGIAADCLKTKGAGRRIANAPYGASESVREPDRKIIIETVTNEGYWNIL